MKNIYRTACWIACLLCCVHTLCGKNVEGDVNYVLIINTYTESTPWSNSMIYPIVSMASQDEKLGVYTEHMNMLMMDGEEELAAFEKNIFKDFETRPPKLIVLLGTASFILCEDLDRQWPDIPIILCGERDYAGNKDMVLKKEPLTPEERMPLTAWQGKYNMTSMPIQVYFEENLDLMKRLIPGMKEVLYIGDETYICQQNDYDLKHLMESGYPELKYRFLCSRDIGIDSLFTILNQIDVRTTGILFSSWFQKRVYAGNTVLYANSHRIIATSSVPLFSFKNVGIEEEGGIIGGFIYNKTDYVAHLCETIREIIGGRQARDIPFYYGPKGTPVFNYQSLLQRNLDPELCPPGTVFLQYAAYLLGEI